MILSVISIFAGLVLLVWGGEWLVAGATRLAARLQISPVVIGLTVVAFGTSAPELGVSLQAAWSGAVDVAVGNVVGSNNFNLLFILGLAALMTPLSVDSKLIRVDTPLMVAASLGTLLLSLDNKLTRIEGGFLFASLLVYLAFCFHGAKHESKAVTEQFTESLSTEPALPVAITPLIARILGGLLLLGLGSRFLVSGAVSIAKYAGVSDLVIGLTIVSIGTSLPEVVTSVVASYRGEKDVAIGNVVGSNLFNLMCVLGLTAVSSPISVPISTATLRWDLPVMVAIAVVCLPIFWTGRRVSRWEGGVMLSAYFVYLAIMLRQAFTP